MSTNSSFNAKELGQILAMFAINKFYNDLKSRGYKTRKDVLYEYAEHIEDAYLSFTVPIYNWSVRKTPSMPKKIFQVTWNMDDSKTREREERALLAGIKELKIEGVIITLESYLKNGIILE